MIALVNRRRVTLVAVFSALALAVLLLRTKGDAAQPRVPTSDDEILERLPRGKSEPRARDLDRLRRRLAATPDDLMLAVDVARRDVQESRSRSDPRYLGYAQAALAPWWDGASPPPPVLLLRATIRQSTHDFEGALGDLDRLLAQTPEDPQAWVTRAVIETVRGDYDAARSSCASVARVTSALTASVCRESIASLTGDAKGAYGRLASALAVHAFRAQADDPEAEWATSTLGEIAIRAGDAASGERHLARALEMDPTDSYALAAWSDLLLDEGRAPEVAARLADRDANDGLLLRLALAETAAKSKDAPVRVALLASRFDASRARGDVVHRREESRFALGLEHDATRALALAKANWEVQREPWDVRVYLEAAAAAHDPEAASPVLAWLETTHLEDPAIARAAASIRSAKP